MIYLPLMPGESGFGLACRVAIYSGYSTFEEAYAAWQESWPGHDSIGPSTRGKLRAPGMGWWAPHLTPEQHQRACCGAIHRCVVGTGGKYARRPLHTFAKSELRCCPECVRDQTRRFGVATWMRDHNVVGVTMCSIHSRALVSCDIRDNRLVLPADAEYRNALPSSARELAYAGVVAALLAHPRLLRCTFEQLMAFSERWGNSHDASRLFAWAKLLSYPSYPPSWNTTPEVLRHLCGLVPDTRALLAWFTRCTREVE